MREKTCKACKAKFVPTRPMQTVCGPLCAVAKVKSDRQKAEAKKAKEDRKETRQKLEKFKTRTDHIEEAQRAFNRYIRLRDAGRGCISCGVTLRIGGVGGGYDAGHYRSRGAAGHLRFSEDNCHGQCKHCNRYASGNVAAYRLGLLDRIGPERLAALEADNSLANWSKEDLLEIKRIYQAKARELERKA